MKIRIPLKAILKADHKTLEGIFTTAYRKEQKLDKKIASLKKKGKFTQAHYLSLPYTLLRNALEEEVIRRHYDEY